jgi:hypothetical protein
MKYVLLTATLLIFTLGCEKAKPPVEAHPVRAPQPEAQAAPVPISLPDLAGHWTINFVQRHQNKDGSWMPGSGKDIGVLSVDLTNGVNVAEGNHALCTPRGDAYGLNMMVMLDQNGKPGETCYTSIGSFDGSRGQLSPTEAVLVTADNDMGRPNNVGAETEQFPANTMVRRVSLLIEFHNDFYSTKVALLDGTADISNGVISGTWSDVGHEQRSGTMFGQRTSAQATNAVLPAAQPIPEAPSGPAQPSESAWVEEFINNRARFHGHSSLAFSNGGRKEGDLENTATGEIEEHCKLKVTLHSTSSWKSNYEPDAQPSSTKSCTVNLYQLPNAAFKIEKLDANSENTTAGMTMRIRADISWLLEVADEKRVDCDADFPSATSNRQAYMVLTYSSRLDANAAAESMKALVRDSCSPK